MFKTFVTFFRGSAAAAGEEFADRNALVILDQQIRDAANSLERAKRALALAIAQDGQEASRIAGAEAVCAHKTSMLQDVEIGRPLELEALVGSVIELAALTATPVPNVVALHACVSLLAQTLQQAHGRLKITS